VSDVDVTAADALASVRGIMHRVHVTTSPDESIGRALEKMHLFHTRRLFVVRGQDVLGIVGDRALMRVRASARTPAVVCDFMSRAVATVPPTMPAHDAIELLEGRALDALAVVHRGIVIGIVSPTVMPSDKRPSRRERAASR
jgi:CBS domain-containing protein